MKLPLPALDSDEEAEDFVANADLTEYDLSAFRLVKFEFQPTTEAGEAIQYAPDKTK